MAINVAHVSETLFRPGGGSARYDCPMGKGSGKTEADPAAEPFRAGRVLSWLYILGSFALAGLCAMNTFWDDGPRWPGFLLIPLVLSYLAIYAYVVFFRGGWVQFDLWGRRGQDVPLDK